MILVAGGTGFVGGAIVRELVRRGKPVAVLTRDEARARKRFPDLDVQYRSGDVRDPSSLPPALRDAEVVIGAQQFPNSPMEDPKRGNTFEEVDARGTENLVRAARKAGVSRYVYLSGAGAAADSPYHWYRAKWRAETALRESGIPWVIFRPSWVYGPEDRSLNRFLSMSRFLPFVPLIGDPGNQKLQPVFIEDLARAVAEATERPDAEGQVLEMGGPELLTMGDVVRAALQVSGRRRLLLPAPKGVMKAAAAVLQFMPGRPLTPDAVEFVTMDALADPNQVRERLGVRLTPLREGLGTYLRKA